MIAEAADRFVSNFLIFRLGVAIFGSARLVLPSGPAAAWGNADGEGVMTSRAAGRCFVSMIAIWAVERLSGALAWGGI